MGMYDVVDFNLIKTFVIKCPFCGKMLNSVEWQTKQFGNTLSIIDENYLREKPSSFWTYTICDNCGRLIEQFIDVNKIDFDTDSINIKTKTSCTYQFEGIRVVEEKSYLSTPIFYIFNNSEEYLGCVRMDNKHLGKYYFYSCSNTPLSTNHLESIKNFLNSNRVVVEEYYSERKL